MIQSLSKCAGGPAVYHIMHEKYRCLITIINNTDINVCKCKKKGWLDV